MMLGGYIWGTIGDVYGRRKVLMVSLALNAASGLISAFVQNYPGFLFMRFMAGVGCVKRFSTLNENEINYFLQSN